MAWRQTLTSATGSNDAIRSFHVGTIWPHWILIFNSTYNDYLLGEQQIKVSSLANRNDADNGTSSLLRGGAAPVLFTVRGCSLDAACRRFRRSHLITCIQRGIKRRAAVVQIPFSLFAKRKDLRRVGHDSQSI